MIAPNCHQPYTADNPAVTPVVMLARKSLQGSKGRRRTNFTEAPICSTCLPTFGYDWVTMQDNSQLKLMSAPQLSDATPGQCEGCGAPVLTAANSSRKRVYCSNTCRSAMYRKTVSINVTVCGECGGEFSARRGAAYCSNACRQKAYRKRSSGDR